jgi:membrane protease YdiL (CAAX protease family)
LTSVAFAAVHSQYPIELQALIGVTALFWAWIARQAKSIMAPYVAHMTLDWIVDPIL